MARARVDVLFEFDAPQTFKDLSAPLSPHPLDQHDAWFDHVHVQHSKPSAELAKELELKLAKLEHRKEKVQDVQSLKKRRRSADKENQKPKDWREIVVARNKQLKQKKKRFPSLKEARALHEPFKAKKELQGKPLEIPGAPERHRKPLGDLGNKRARPEQGMKQLQEMLKKHNKKFKATHTYEPPQHSIREVKQVREEGEGGGEARN